MSDVLQRLFETRTQNQCVEVAMLCWSIWSRPNNWVWDHKNGSVFGVCNTEWTEAQAKERNRRIRGEMGDRVWTPPKWGWMKINIDADVFQNGSIGVAAVIRDDQGRFVGARCMKIAGAWKPIEAEAIGLREALSWVIDRGYKHCVIETDTYVLADACNGNPGRALFGNIVMDCIHLVKHINPVLVNFVYRSLNNVAHVLAKATCSMLDVGEWYSTPPSFLMLALELDLIY
ncbi:uncharacterized protein LOC141725107 [Apium graveolens]|uniref:uncharacterized protein LOC141725107 n=1 Tax=Apium graveolens TaxID=4045 RepID=UPI003D799C42